MTTFAPKLTARPSTEHGRRSRLLKALTSRGSRAADFYFDADAYDRRPGAHEIRLPVESMVLAFRI